MVGLDRRTSGNKVLMTDDRCHCPVGGSGSGTVVHYENCELWISIQENARKAVIDAKNRGGSATYLVGYDRGQRFAGEGGSLRDLPAEAGRQMNHEGLRGEPRDAFLRGFKDGYKGWEPEGEST